MKSIRKILAATDFSFHAHRAARRAGFLAREHDATLRLLHVINSNTAMSAFQFGVEPPLDLDQRVAQDAQRGLESLAGDVAAPNLVVEREVRTGIVLDQILAAADEADILVLGPRGLRPIHELILGTAAERLLNKSHRPMIVVKQDPTREYRRVLVPVDFSEHSMTALRFARSLAPTAEIGLFHALEAPAEGTLRNAAVAEESINAYRSQVERDARGQMDKLIADAGEMRGPLLPMLQKGDPRLQINAMAESYAADLIVIGKHGRSRISEFFLGGATRLTLARAQCDVAVVPEASGQ
ncbi:MAG TPA: universal stress protein [Steroidobacteraceae bacterium]|nr:universal stress protein [Steroidobacteraceae bacterium]